MRGTRELFSSRATATFGLNNDDWMTGGRPQDLHYLGARRKALFGGQFTVVYRNWF